MLAQEAFGSAQPLFQNSDYKLVKRRVDFTFAFICFFGFAELISVRYKLAESPDCGEV